MDLTDPISLIEEALQMIFEMPRDCPPDLDKMREWLKVADTLQTARMAALDYAGAASTAYQEAQKAKGLMQCSCCWLWKDPGEMTRHSTGYGADPKGAVILTAAEKQATDRGNHWSTCVQCTRKHG